MSNKETLTPSYYIHKLLQLITFLILTTLAFYIGKNFITDIISEIANYIMQLNVQSISDDVEFSKIVKLSLFPALEILLIFLAWHAWLRLISGKERISILTIAKYFSSYILLILSAGLIFSMLFSMMLGDMNKPVLNFAIWFAIFVNIFLIMALTVITKYQND